MRMRSLLFLPGNSPSLLGNADILGADAVIFDLEDAVSPDEKDAARILVRNAMPKLRAAGLSHVVRINAVADDGFWRDDLMAVLPSKPDYIMPTKVSDTRALDDVLGMIKEMGADAQLIPLIETAMGVEHALAIASFERVAAVLLGAEDLTADLGCPRTAGGAEIAYARGRIVMAARAAGVVPIDTPFTDVFDDEGAFADAQTARSLGFAGKAAISPRHIEGINRAFSPTEAEIQYAKDVLAAIEQGRKEGKGAVSLGGKMIDAPIVNRAKKLLGEVAQ